MRFVFKSLLAKGIGANNHTSVIFAFSSDSRLNFGMAIDKTTLDTNILRFGNFINIYQEIITVNNQCKTREHNEQAQFSVYFINLAVSLYPAKNHHVPNCFVKGTCHRILLAIMAFP